MKRVSLDVRLRGTSLFEPKGQALARMPVDEFYDRLEALTGPCPEVRKTVLDYMSGIGFSPSMPMCDVVGKLIREDVEVSDKVLFNLLVIPFSQVHAMKGREKHE